MKKKTAPLFCIGIDIAAETFVAQILHRETGEVSGSREFTQTPEAYEAFAAWVAQHHRIKRSILFVMESTGNFSHKLCYWLHGHGYRVAVADAFRISRSDRPNHPKNDHADSRRIAEYGMRHFDQLTRWRPADPVLARINKLLGMRELLVRINTMCRNQLYALRFELSGHDDLGDLLKEEITLRRKKILLIEKNIIAAIKEHEHFHTAAALICSVPGCGWLMAANLLVITDGQTGDLNHRSLANYLGIAPHEHTSGTSIRHRARTSRLGPPRMRKILFLASWTVRAHNPHFRQWYQEMIQRGKPKLSALNAIANKLLKIICSILRSQKPYDETFVSVKPVTDKS
jgi:transposase